MAQEDEGKPWDDDERYYSSGRDSDDSPLLSHRTCEQRRYEEYPPAKEERERRSTLSVLMKFFLFSTAMITFCVLLYIPVYNKANNYQMSKALVAGWSTHTNRDTKLYVLPNNVTIIHEPTNICDKQTNKLFLLIIICSATDNFDRRIDIRNTWGNYNTYNDISKTYNIIKEKYKNYNYTYDLYTNNTKTRNKRDDVASISKLLPQLAKVLENNISNNKTEERFQEDTMFKDFEQTDYNNYDYESNIMKIPPRGYEDSPDLDKIMNLLKHDKIFPKNGENLVDGIDFRIVFLLGLPVQRNDSTVQERIDEEVEKYGDIIQEGFLDSYNNLTLKSMMMLKWINNKCNHSVRYILKTDDDMYINVPNLIWNLKNRSRDHDAKVAKWTQVAGVTSHDVKEYLLIGDLICGARPVLDATNKWYSPRYMYNARVYPRYLSGTGYVFTSHTAASLYAAALTTPYFHLEDIFITGICSLRASPRIPPRDDPTFSYSPPPGVTGDPRPAACAAHGRVTTHRVGSSLLNVLHDMLANVTVVDTCERIRLTEIKRQLAPEMLHTKLIKFLAGKECS